METHTRPSFEVLYMTLAFGLAQRSTCRRLSVGTVITTTDYRQVLAVGYNGNATGLANHCDSDVPGSCGCLHSEENACINCQAPRSTPKVVFVTHLPCVMCAKRMLNLGGVQRVYYSQEYRIATARELLEKNGIQVTRLHTPASEVLEKMNWNVMEGGDKPA